jgi:hypothetical protein
MVREGMAREGMAREEMATRRLQALLNLQQGLALSNSVNSVGGVTPIRLGRFAAIDDTLFMK